MTGVLPHILYGGDYNPDQWPEEIWAEDVRLMRQAGVNVVSLGVFSWSRIQPTAETWDFDWLDRVMAMLHEGGIRVNLATATASPPPWLSHAHPEMLPTLADGTRLWHGARQHYCPSSPVFREAARRLVEKMAERYGSHPALALWHVGNESGCHVPACYCDVSAAAFRRWLQARYASVEDLNRAWGTAFWSQRYSDWAEIIPPRRTPTWPNPSQQLDFHRFCSDELLECYMLEREVLKRITPDVPVTTNFMGVFKPLDYWSWAASEDVVSNDSYPDPSDPASPMRAAMAGDLMRSLGRGQLWNFSAPDRDCQLYESNITLDFARPADDLSAYRAGASSVPVPRRRPRGGQSGGVRARRRDARDDVLQRHRRPVRPRVPRRLSAAVSQAAWT